MTTLCLILAAGPSREPFELPRQLLPIGGEPLLARTVRQAWARWDDVAVVSDQKAILDACSCATVTAGKPSGCCDSMMMGLAGMVKHHDRVVILLGDVYYTDATMGLIASERASVAFFVDGGNQETFALVFMRERMGQIVARAQVVVLKAHGVRDHAGFKQLRIDLMFRQIELETRLITDETQDFDTPAQYKDFLKGRSKNLI